MPEGHLSPLGGIVKGCRPLTDPEIGAALEELDRTRYPARNRALFLLGLHSGFRISELLSLKLKDVFQNGHFVDVVQVERKHMKKKMESRAIDLHPEAKAELELWIKTLTAIVKSEDPGLYIFRSREGGNHPLDRRSAYHLLKKAYAKCGMNGKLGTHSMRKTYANTIHRDGGNDLFKTQRALGHKNINSTVAYLSFDDTEVRDLVLGTKWHTKKKTG